MIRNGGELLFSEGKPGKPGNGRFPLFSGISCAAIVLVASLLFGSCSNLRYLDEGQSLYTGSRVIIETEEPVKNKKELQSELASLISPQPNNKILIWRPRLWLYNITSSSGESGISGWINRRLGRPPVLIEDVNTERTIRLMENRLLNSGYFDASAGYRLTERNRQTGVEYRVTLKPPYTIGNILPVQEDMPVAGDINNSMKETVLKSGQAYSLSGLKEERERIDRYLKEVGYFYFHPDYLLFMADSTAGNREVDLYLTLKPVTPPDALEKYTIRNIYIDNRPPAAGRESTEPAGMEEIKDGVFMYTGDGLLNARTLLRAIFLEKDKTYSYTDHILSIRHLMGLGVFKFVNIHFDRVNYSGNNYLDVRIALTPMEKRSVSAELRGISKSNDFAGPGLTASFINRNLLGIAGNFSLNLDGAFETLIGQKGVNSLEAGISSEISIPGMLAPFGAGNISPAYIPVTGMSLSFNYLNRTDAFSLTSLRSQFGYKWNTSVSTQHRLNPFVFNVFGLGAISDEYERIFSGEALLKRGLFEQFLLGSEYSFLHNTQLSGIRQHDWYLNFNIDLSGNVAWLMSNLLGSAGDKDDYRIFNQSFSQYTRTDIDLRYYLRTGPNSRLATRLIAGIGLPYGNSTTMPYTKLFTMGGSNSIRAFHPRSLGPGSYTPPDTLTSTLNIYQSGEIKLEMNIEYRFALGNIVKAAIFADAGNIWNIKEKENAPGGKFHSAEFLRQTALGTGAGLRFDFTFFLLRLDLAFPLADPGYSGERKGWLVPVKPFDSAWRSNNLILNLAIGYPF